MQILINSQVYILEEFEYVQVSYDKPIPLDSLKPDFRCSGNTIGRIPLQFLEQFEYYKEFRILRYLFNNLPNTLNQFISCHIEYRKLLNARS